MNWRVFVFVGGTFLLYAVFVRGLYSILGTYSFVLSFGVAFIISGMLYLALYPEEPGDPALG